MWPTVGRQNAPSDDEGKRGSGPGNRFEWPMLAAETPLMRHGDAIFNWDKAQEAHGKY